MRLVVYHHPPVLLLNALVPREKTTRMETGHPSTHPSIHPSIHAIVTMIITNNSKLRTVTPSRTQTQDDLPEPRTQRVQSHIAGSLHAYYTCAHTHVCQSAHADSTRDSSRLFFLFLRLVCIASPGIRLHSRFFRQQSPSHLPFYLFIFFGIKSRAGLGGPHGRQRARALFFLLLLLLLFSLSLCVLAHT